VGARSLCPSVTTFEFLTTLKLAEQKNENMIREIILPYLDRQIASAEKKSG
jgi:hypothetical protein